MPFLSSISWSGMPTGGFCQGIRWVTEFGQANGTSPAWARWGISQDRRGSRGGGRPRVGRKGGHRRKHRKAEGCGGERGLDVVNNHSESRGKPPILRAVLSLFCAHAGVE